jgi:hypothetical protein
MSVEMEELMQTQENSVVKIKVSEVMKRASFHRYEAKMIMKLDLSNLDHPTNVVRVVDYLVGMVKKMPKLSVVGLVDLNGLLASDEIKQELSRLAEITYPYFRASALMACDARSRELAATITSRIGETKLPVYEDEEAAMKWLFAQ